MRTPQELPAAPCSPPAATALPLRTPRRGSLLRRVVGVLGGALWWWATLRLAVRPDAVGPWQSAAAAGGWSLGLIPLHAVPVRIRRPARPRPTAATPPPDAAPS